MRATDGSAIAERLADRAVELAEALLREARTQQTSEERAQAGKLARMMADPHGKELTIALADQAFRSRRPISTRARSISCGRWRGSAG